MQQVRTTDDVSRYMDQIDKYLADVYKSAKNYETECPEIINYLNDSGIDPKDTSKSKEIVENLRKDLQNLERIQLTLREEPGLNTIKKIYDKLVLVLGNDRFVLEFKIDPTIIGGLKISYKGKYRDLSLVNSVNTFFTEHRNLDELLQ